jgi:RNA polymerase sigma-70 factor (ECF subfamily)
MSDQEIPNLITRAAKGDPQAFRQIVTQNQRFLYSVAYRFLGNAQDSEDVIQETFIRLWKNLPNYRAEIKLTTWLYKIVVNQCLDMLKSTQRRQQRVQVDLMDYTLVVNNATDAALHSQDLHRIIQEAASKLTPKQKAVFILRDLEDLPVDEVCSILSMSAGNVKSNLYYARQQMSEKLKMYYQVTDKMISL